MKSPISIYIIFLRIGSGATAIAFVNAIHGQVGTIASSGSFSIASTRALQPSSAVIMNFVESAFPVISDSM